MEEGSTVVADPPILKPADPLRSEPKPDDAVGSDNQPPAIQNPDPTPKPELKEGEEQKPAVVDSQPQTKKRKLDHSHGVSALRKSSYFKIRSIIKDLRPFFIEVIHAPDFRESKAAHDIRKQMKTMLELTRQLRNEASLAEANKEEKHKERENHAPQAQNGKVPISSDNAMENAEEEKNPGVTNVAKQLEEGFQGTYVTGGSPVGWNFLAYPGSKPIYYGVTKASFRASQAAK